jgi:hypothetical protein
MSEQTYARCGLKPGRAAPPRPDVCVWRQDARAPTGLRPESESLGLESLVYPESLLMSAAAMGDAMGVAPLPLENGSGSFRRRKEPCLPGIMEEDGVNVSPI